MNQSRLVIKKLVKLYLLTLSIMSITKILMFYNLILFCNFMIEILL